MAEDDSDDISTPDPNRWMVDLPVGSLIPADAMQASPEPVFRVMVLVPALEKLPSGEAVEFGVTARDIFFTRQEYRTAEGTSVFYWRKEGGPITTEATDE